MNCTQAGHEAGNTASSAVACPGRSEGPLTEQHLRNLSLARCQPALFDALSLLVATADPLRRDMEDSLDQLKESFLLVIDDLFRQGGIDRGNRLILGFEDGVLKIVDRSHPQAGEADAILAGVPVLAAVLRQIAADTLLLRSLETLGQAFDHCADGPSTVDDAIESYQVCLKGPLSHFYSAT